MSTSDVSELIAALRSGDMNLEDVVQRFRTRTWPESAVPLAQTYQELAAAALRDPEPDVPGSFDEVTAAYDRGEITQEQYRALAHAAAEAINAQARREAEQG
jgi:predicted RNA-binding protein associated with RNAse of E/G family